MSGKRGYEASVLVVLSLIAGFIAGLTSISLCVSGATTTTSGRTQLYFYNINVTMINQEPSPAEAGRYVIARFKFENSGAENAEDIVVELIPKYPFSLEPGDSAVKHIGSIRSMQLGDTGVIIDYRLKVDENALEGYNEIGLKYRIKDYSWTRLEPFYINIMPHDMILSIASIESPKMIGPGEAGRIDINLRNLALSFIKDIKVKLNLDGIPFATSGSTNRKIIKQIEGGDEAAVSFSLMAEPDADSRLYKVPIELEFLDRLGTVYRENETIGLIVGAEPELSIAIESSQIYSSGGSGEVVIKFVNKGVTDIKFLSAVLKESDGFKILSPKEVYVGNIDSDDYETADFRLALKKVKGNIVGIPLAVEYKDANNNKYSREIELPLKLYSSSEARLMGIKSRSNRIVGVSIAIIIVIGGFFIYRKFYRKWRKH